MDNGDQVKRKAELLAAHPEWGIISPFDVRSVLRGELCWRGLGPDGKFFRETELSHLLDRIEADLTEKGGTTGDSRSPAAP